MHALFLFHHYSIISIHHALFFQHVEAERWIRSSRKVAMAGFTSLIEAEVAFRYIISAMHASAVVKVAHDKLVTALGDAAVTMPEDLRRHLEELKGKMETMVQVLGDAERRSVREQEVREWLMRLEDAAYGIWDMVDEIQANNKVAPVCDWQ